MKFDGNMAGQSNSQSQVNDLFEKLISWRDESHEKISSIINSHNSTVKKGINDLVKEVSNLQDELSVIRMERKGPAEAINTSLTVAVVKIDTGAGGEATAAVPTVG